MKKGYHILIGLIAIIVIGLFLYYLIWNNDAGEVDILKYDPIKAESIGISRDIEKLEDCQGMNLAQTEEDRFEFCSYDISDNNLTKLKAIENIKGNKICSFDQRYSNNDCHISSYIKPGSETIWRFDWTEIIVRKNHKYILLAKEGDNYYFVYADDKSIGSFSGSIYIIEDLNPEMITKLQSD